MDESSRLAVIGLHKSNSCPDLTIYREEDPTPVMPRRNKRAFSECQHPDAPAATADSRGRASSMVSIVRTQSDSDLRKIDRKRTFAQINTVEPNDLLAKVANALSQLRPADEDEGQGIHGFSDAEILASERTWGGWANNNGRRDHRVRAASETRLPHELGDNEAYEWTWSGANNQINDLRKLRQKNNGPHDLYRASFGGNAATRRQSDGFKGSSNATVIAIPATPSAETTITAGQNRFMGRLNNIFRKRAMSTTSSSMMQQLPSNIHEDAIKYLREYPGSSTRYLNTNTYAGGGGGASVPNYSRRGSIYESLQSGENSQILENTTIADLIKVLEAVHTQAALENELPKRKLGNATPPEMPSIFGLFDPTPDRKLYDTYNPPMRDRRGSMFPSLGYLQNSSRRASLMPTASNKPHPPPYSSLETAPQAAPTHAKRRFSVRPAALSSNSPQLGSSVTSLASSSASQMPPVTRKLSLRPSPLATSSFRDRDSSRFTKPKSLQREVISQNARQRHGSLSNLPEKLPEKKRYDSK